MDMVANDNPTAKISTRRRTMAARQAYFAPVAVSTAHMILRINLSISTCLTERFSSRFRARVSYTFCNQHDLPVHAANVPPAPCPDSASGTECRLHPRLFPISPPKLVNFPRTKYLLPPMAGLHGKFPIASKFIVKHTVLQSKARACRCSFNAGMSRSNDCNIDSSVKQRGYLSFRQNSALCGCLCFYLINQNILTQALHNSVYTVYNSG